MGNSATIEIKADKSGLKGDLDASEALINKFATGVKVALVAAAGAFAVKTIASSLGGWISAASEAGAATAKLEAIVKRQGETAGYSAKQLETMADDLEKLTGIQAETVQQAQALLLVFDNIRGDQFDRATKGAADLATVMGGDVTGAARVLGKALDDPVDAVNNLTRAGIDFSESQKEMIKSMAESGDIVGAQTIILDALESKVGGTAEAMGQTFGGQLKILEARFGDLGETIGGFIIPYIEALFPAAEIAVAGLQAVLDIIGDMIGAGDDFDSSFSDTIVAGLKYVTEIFVDSFTYTLAFFETWGAQVERATYAVMLGFVTVFEDLKKWLTDDIPAYLNWFGKNWQNIFTDMAAFTSTIVGNMYENLVNFFTDIFLWMSGQKTGSWEWKGLTDGFKATMDALPEIAQRGMTETEKQLAANINQMGDVINAKFAERTGQGKAFVDKMFAAKPEKEKQVPKESDKARRVVGKPEAKTEEKAGGTYSGSSSGSGGGSGGDTKSTAGSIVGLEALYNQIGTAAKDMGNNQIAAGVQMQVQQQAAQGAKQQDNAVALFGKIDKIVTALEKLNLGLA